jgi:ribulose-phosphate 3-epimerase
MSVPAGFGGQQFHPIALEKLRQIRQMARTDVLLEVDGGINPVTIRQCAEAGAQLFVVGSAIFRAADYGQAIRDLSTLATV